MAYTTLRNLKRHLNIELSTSELTTELEVLYNEDDVYLQSLILVSESAISNYCNGGLDLYTDLTMPKTIIQASLLFCAHMYLNRSMISFAQGYELPYSFQFLLNPYKNITIC